MSEDILDDIGIDDDIDDLEESLVDEEGIEPSSFEVSDELWETLLKLKQTYPSKNFKPIQKETAKHRAMFCYWMSLGSMRSDIVVARQFEVSPAAVGKTRKSFNWEGRNEYLAKEAADAETKLSGRTLLDQLRLYMVGCDFVRIAFVNKLKVKNNDVKISVQDFITISDKQIELLDKVEAVKTSMGGSGDFIADLEDSMNGLGADAAGAVESVFKEALKESIPIDSAIEIENAREVQEHIDTAEIGEDNG